MPVPFQEGVLTALMERTGIDPAAVKVRESFAEYVDADFPSGKQTVYAAAVVRGEVLGDVLTLDAHINDNAPPVYRGLDRFRGDAQFTTWLYRITANCAATHLGKRSRHRHDAGELPARRDAIRDQMAGTFGEGLPVAHRRRVTGRQCSSAGMP